MLVVFSCREPFEIESIEFQNSLVVEATLTNEIKQHIVTLSRTYELNQEGPAFENDAVVFIEDSTGNIFEFVSIGEGRYQSENEFQAVPDINYQLLITTSEGEQFQSSSIALTPISEITNIYGELQTNNDGEQGVQILLDTDNQNSGAAYYRYEYEETYQVIPPYYFPFKAILTNYSEEIIYVPHPTTQVFYDIEFIPRAQEEETCYTTRKQNGILLTTTNSLNDNSVVRFPIRFIDKDDGILRDRYSILVRQYVQSIEAYSYYKALDDLGDVESILSQSQPGYVFGNITSENNPEQSVIGYFEVASVSEQRIFMDYTDFNLTRPDYLYACEIVELDYNDNSDADFDKNEKYEIYRLLTVFAEQNQNYDIIEIPQPNPDGIWRLVKPECGDCTSISSNIRPDFWED